MSKIRRKMQLLEMDRHRLEEESAPGDGAVTHGNALMPESFVPDSGDNIIASESDVRDGSCDDDSDVQIINVIAGDSDDEEESRMEPEDVEHDMKRQDLTKVNGKSTPRIIGFSNLDSPQNLRVRLPSAGRPGQTLRMQAVRWNRSFPPPPTSLTNPTRASTSPATRLSKIKSSL